MHKIIVSAPGSLMLTGEHAVLRGHPALVAAIDKRIHIEISKNNNNKIHIDSDKFGIKTIATVSPPLKKGAERSEGGFKDLTPPYHFIKNTLSHFSKNLTQGINIKITSEFSPTVGLGSSAALTVALLYALSLWFEQPLSPNEQAIIGRNIIQQSQNGLGSGADVMASIFGGVVYYITEPFLVETIPVLPPLITVYSGSKTPTSEVIALVNKKDKKLTNALFEKIGNCSQQAHDAILKKDWPELGKIFNQHAKLQSELGVSTPVLDLIQKSLREDPSIFGAKISGSGLGDCVIGLGSLNNVIENIIDIKISSEGVRCESK